MKYLGVSFSLSCLVGIWDRLDPQYFILVIEGYYLGQFCGGDCRNQGLMRQQAGAIKILPCL